MLTVKQKHAKNVIHCLVFVGKIPRCGAYLGAVFISIFILRCSAYSGGGGEAKSGVALNQVNTVFNFLSQS